ncbi:YbaK/EbsC family protein [Mesorhizobium ciceri]|uniref:aminoacyl-tRNA deacylase n=1 Tax=Mesorhizobium ciceri TaxID=39645 RepID=UPI0007A9527C|nr:YbaK/EbsC family protein [Mesorhizobium ciceri]AMY00672.1 hypothetical protein A4R29_15075 [Mesorhizobium ciceri biovar biserrulae]
MHKLVSQGLAASNASWKVWDHAKLGKAISNPSEFAAAIGADLDRIAKTVLLADRRSSGDERRACPERHLGAVCLPIASKIDFQSVALKFGWNACELAKPDQLMAIVGYPPKGVSPIGLAPIRLIIDEGLMKHRSVIVGAGAVGIEVELDPLALAALTGALVSRIQL